MNYKNKDIKYFDHPYNTTRQNERTVEVPLAKLFLESHLDLIEIGCVTPYYFTRYDHKVYDLTDGHLRAINLDALTLDVKGKNVLSISTIEHFGEDEVTSDSVKFLDRVMKESKKYLITFPLGINKKLDEYVAKNIDCSYLSRKESNRDLWEVKEYKDLSDFDKKYGSYHKGGTIAVIENFL